MLLPDPRHFHRPPRLPLRFLPRHHRRRRRRYRCRYRLPPPTTTTPAPSSAPALRPDRTSQPRRRAGPRLPISPPSSPLDAHTPSQRRPSPLPSPLTPPPRRRPWPEPPPPPRPRGTDRSARPASATIPPSARHPPRQTTNRASEASAHSSWCPWRPAPARSHRQQQAR